jgi:aminoglycoside phosphotransferase (APT) family kinase protein
VLTGLRPFGDGHSGYTYEVPLSSGLGVVRLSPPGARVAGPADVGRQGRIMAALGQAGAPVPRVLDYDSAPVVDGRAFVLMELCPGVGWEQARQTMSDTEMARAAIEAMRTIQSIPVEQTGLVGEAPFGPEAELDRWAPLVQRAPRRLRPMADRLERALRAGAPAATPARLVHGDYHYGNLLFEAGAVVGVVDWEIAALGESLVDLACLAVATLRRRYDPEPNPTGGLDISLGDLAAMYGADPDHAAWFCAQSCFKYAAILGYNLELHLRGKREDVVYEQLQETMMGLPLDAMALLEGGLDAQR